MSKDRFMIIDGNALVHRAFHALPPLSTKEGMLVNAVYGFTTVLMKALKELQPAYAAVTFDLPGGTFRDELYKDYKAQRIKQPQELYDQLPLVKEVVRAFGIPVVEKQGFEADDVIATLCQVPGIREQVLEKIIVTGDMDTLQLVDVQTKVYSFRKGFSDTVIYDETAVQERYGLKPNQIVDYKALRGDPSDNIPGVKGVGEKTATELLQQFGTLEEIYKNVQKISGRVGELLQQHRAEALLGKKLVTLVRDIPVDVSLDDCKVLPPNKKQLREVFEKFGFKNLVARLDGEEKKEQGSLLSGVAESSSLGLRPPPPLGRGEGEGQGVVMVTSSGTMGHDLKAYLRQCQASGGTCQMSPPFFDIMIAAYLLNPGRRMHDLESIAREHNVAADISELAPKLKSELEKAGLWRVFSEIEMPLIPVLAAMEERGIKVDALYLKKLSQEFSKELATLTKKIYKLAGEEFNIASPLQLREILFDKLKLAPSSGRIKKTAKGGVASTAAGELEKLRGTHPILDLIFDYRELAKLQSTYTDALIELIDQKDGRIHTTFNQAVASTGRLSSSNPNLQNIPVKTETGRQIRKAFVADKGAVLLSADYSQIELRVAASLSKDAEMIKAFQSGHDFHTETAVRVFGVSADKVTSEMRRNAKAINFGIIYGMGVTSLAQSTGRSRSEAEQYITRYFKVYHGLYAFLEGLKQHARDKGYVATLFGRRRYLPEITSGVQQVRATAERMAQNMPIQGTSADLMKMAMIKLHNTLLFPERSEAQSRGDIRMLLQVHDELVFEIKTEMVQATAPKIKAIMESVHTLKVPIFVDLKQGQNWGQMESIV